MLQCLDKQKVEYKNKASQSERITTEREFHLAVDVRDDRHRCHSSLIVQSEMLVG